MIDIAMMVAGVGMQFFNNYANNKKNDELQAKQREFQRAAAAQDFERMRKLQAESARIALELEEELHKERMNDINNQYDSVLDNFAHSFTISNWPLNVLPFIMKGESFGSLIHDSSKSIHMHCIFTPSNCEWFNSNFYDDIDLRLEANMNNNWNAQSSHPIVYYGGAWNRKFGESATISLNEVELLKINLRGIPTMIVTPYFDPWLHFRVEIWGMGIDTSEHFRIDIPHGDIEYTNRIFSYDYNKNETNNIDDEDFQNFTINEFVPYLENLIGFVADKYFWSMYGKTPQLPTLISKKANNFAKKITIKGYKDMFSSIMTGNSNITAKENILCLYSGIKPLLNSDEKLNYQSKILDSLYDGYGLVENPNIEVLKKCFNTSDILYLNNLLTELDDSNAIKLISEVYTDIKSKIPCAFTTIIDITFKDILDIAKDIMIQPLTNDVKVEIRENNILIALLQNDGETFISDEENPKCVIVTYENLIIPDRLKIKSGSFIIKKDNFDTLYMQIEQLYNN